MTFLVILQLFLLWGQHFTYLTFFVVVVKDVAIIPQSKVTPGVREWGERGRTDEEWDFAFLKYFLEDFFNFFSYYQH
jgi:hypothetical protein